MLTTAVEKREYRARFRVDIEVPTLIGSEIPFAEFLVCGLVAPSGEHGKSGQSDDGMCTITYLLAILA